MRSLAGCLVLAFFLTLGHRAQGVVSMATLGQSGAFMNLVAHIVAVNLAFEDASRNPMDDRRRERARRAVSLLPAAIMGLAAEFKSGNLHDTDLPLVQSILGGFVDVAAGERFNKFLKNPQRSLIPQTGKNFPKNVKPIDIDTAPLVPISTASATRPQGAATTRSELSTNSNPEIANLQPPTPVRFTPGTVGQRVFSAYGYDSSIRKGTSGNTVFSSQQSISDSSGSISDSSRIVDEAKKDLTSIETGQTNSLVTTQEVTNTETREPDALPTVRITTGESSNKANADKRSPPSEVEFFKAVSKSQDEALELDEKPLNKKGIRKILKKSSRIEDPKDYSLGRSAKYFSVKPLIFFAESLLLEGVARAEGGKCKDCGGGDKGGGGGDIAGQILAGIAMIIAALAPVAVAKIQADADIKIANMQADTTKELAHLSANTSLELAGKQEAIEMKKTKVAVDIAQQNNDSQTERLSMQLAELKSARDDARQAEKEKRSLEKAYNDERVALAKKTSDDNMKVAKQTLDASLTRAGLVSGGSAGTNSASNLSVTRVGDTGGSTVSSAIASNAPSLGAPLNSGTASPNPSTAIPSLPSQNTAPKLGIIDESTVTVRAPTSNTSNTSQPRNIGAQDQLLFKLSKPPSEEESENEARENARGPRPQVRFGSRGAYKGKGRGIGSPYVSGTEVRQVLNALADVAGGSTAQRLYTNGDPQDRRTSDIEEFRSTALRSRIPNLENSVPHTGTARESLFQGIRGPIPTTNGGGGGHSTSVADDNNNTNTSSNDYSGYRTPPLPLNPQALQFFSGEVKP